MTEFEEKIEKYRQEKAKNISIAVMLYILSVVAVIAFPCFLPVKGGVIGVLIMICMIAFATGLIIYTSMKIPQDVAEFLSEKENVSKEIITKDGKKIIYKKNKDPVLQSLNNLYWLIVTIIYLGVSFLTGAWGITWLIWLIGTAIEQGIKMIFLLKNQNNEKEEIGE